MKRSSQNSLCNSSIDGRDRSLPSRLPISRLNHGSPDVASSLRSVGHRSTRRLEEAPPFERTAVVLTRKRTTGKSGWVASSHSSRCVHWPVRRSFIPLSLTRIMNATVTLHEPHQGKQGADRMLSTLQRPSAGMLYSTLTRPLGCPHGRCSRSRIRW